jgi:hypothetical protein
MQITKPLEYKSIITKLMQIQDEIGELIEELEILSDDELMRDIEESKNDFEERKYYTFEEIVDTHKKLGKK